MTNRGQLMLLKFAFGEETVPTSFKVKLVTDSSIAPTVDLFAELNERPAGGGYSLGGTSFDKDDITFTQYNGAIHAMAVVADDTILWTATGPIPSSGTGYTFAVITDGSTADNVIAYVDLDGPDSLNEFEILSVNKIQFWSVDQSSL